MSEETNKLEWQVIGQLVSSIQVEQRCARLLGYLLQKCHVYFFVQRIGHRG